MPDNKLDFTIIFPDDIKLASVNSIYEPKHAKGGKIIGFYLNPDVVRMKKHIQTSMKAQGLKRHDIPNNWGLLKVSYIFIVKENIFKRDVDNFLKASQDAIFSYLGRNDATILQLEAAKYLNPSAEFESMKCVIEGLGSDSRLYNLDLLLKSTQPEVK